MNLKSIKYHLFVKELSVPFANNSLSPVTLVSEIVQDFSNLFDPVQVAPLGIFFLFLCFFFIYFIRLTLYIPALV